MLAVQMARSATVSQGGHQEDVAQSLRAIIETRAPARVHSHQALGVAAGKAAYFFGAFPIGCAVSARSHAFKDP